MPHSPGSVTALAAICFHVQASVALAFRTSANRALATDDPCEGCAEGSCIHSGGAVNCAKCPVGSVLIKGPPPNYEPSYDASGYGDTEPVYTHCAKLQGEIKRLLMIRHGQSQWNEMMEKTHSVAGVVGMFGHWTDSPLSKFGLRQAQRLAQILYKADASAHTGEHAGWNGLEAVAPELLTTDLETLVHIKNKSSSDPNAMVSDAAAVAQLQLHKTELDILSGRECKDTRFVSSQLVRAMDTLLIATLPSRVRCDAQWEISSNLQEIEHNADCEARTDPGTHPITNDGQSKEYVYNQMEETLNFVRARYAGSNVDRFTENRPSYERVRLFDQSKQMVAEAQNIFQSPQKYVVWGGHSIWFRQFFQSFGVVNDPTCQELTKTKIANTGIVATTLRSLEGDPQRFVAMDCEYIHLGPSGKYKFALNSDAETSRVPTFEDFADAEAEGIMGWQCCCSRAAYEGEPTGHFGFGPVDPSKYREACVVARTTDCRYPDKWKEVSGESVSKAAAQAYTWKAAFGDHEGGCKNLTA